ncbi:putative mediator of RNA polymerase II transcription subunit 26 isoform X3 [Fundulus heteroclitus]|uniref:putative mediator of RNA polymerase II transcription subunit 26 isoform X3 n=1 Tax=Fundulus heteroclitus TaxID=8078 RepID=UPI00165AA9FE|nr:putative mediator of RNA polymerase II transcription subunit 26 isoform X3 [Fundulus heteroclitus]
MSVLHKQSKSNPAQQIIELSQRISTMETNQQEEYTTMGSSLKKAQEELRLLNERIIQVKEFECQHQYISPGLEQAEEKFSSVNRRIQQFTDFFQSQHAEMRRALQEESENVRPLCERSDLNMSQTSYQQRIDMIEEHHQQQLQKLRFTFAQAEAEFGEVKHSIQQIESTQQQKLHELSSAQQPSKEDKEVKIHQQRTVLSKEEDPQRIQKTGTFSQRSEQRSLQHRLPLQPYEHNPNHLDPRLREMAEELQTMRSALKEKEEELKSFKDRVAVEVAPSIKTGTSMSLNSPVSKNRIREMYETLRCDWPKIKENLKSNGKKPDLVKKMVQKKFKMAKTDMEKKKMMIIKVFDLDKYKPGTEPPKVKEHMQMTIQSLQLALYSQKYEDGAQKPSSSDEVENPKEMMTYLGNECYWLGCLMALNNPPIHPDWQNHPPSMDKWDILPRNIVATSKEDPGVQDRFNPKVQLFNT